MSAIFCSRSAFSFSSASMRVALSLLPFEDVSCNSANLRSASSARACASSARFSASACLFVASLMRSCACCFMVATPSCTVLFVSAIFCSRSAFSFTNCSARLASSLHWCLRAPSCSCVRSSLAVFLSASAAAATYCACRSLCSSMQCCSSFIRAS